MDFDKEDIRVWCIGPDGTEYYAAHSEAEMRQFYIEMVGKEQAEEDFAADFTEVPSSKLDEEFDELDESGKVIGRTTWRKRIAVETRIPTQIASGYN